MFFNWNEEDIKWFWKENFIGHTRFNQKFWKWCLGVMLLLSYRRTSIHCWTNSLLHRNWSLKILKANEQIKIVFVILLDIPIKQTFLPPCIFFHSVEQKQNEQDNESPFRALMKPILSKMLHLWDLCCTSHVVPVPLLTSLLSYWKSMAVK
jgi:hypothetical protein